MNTFFYYRFVAVVFAIASYGLSPYTDLTAQAAQDALPSIQRPTPPRSPTMGQDETRQERVNPFDLILEKEKEAPEGMTSWRSAEDTQNHMGEQLDQAVDDRIKDAVRHMYAVTEAETGRVMKQMKEENEEHIEAMTASQKVLAEKFAKDDNASDQVEIDLKSWEPSKARSGSYSSQIPRQEKTNTTGLEMPKRLWSVD
jgi:hypothetical protein